MNQTQAIAKLTKVLGKNLMWRENKKAATREEREAARAELAAASAEAKAAEEAENARKAEVLASDVQYQSLKKARVEAQAKRDTLRSASYSYRLSVGLDVGYAFRIEAEGDNWTDVVEKVCNKVKA